MGEKEEANSDTNHDESRWSAGATAVHESEPLSGWKAAEKN